MGGGVEAAFRAKNHSKAPCNCQTVTARAGMTLLFMTQNNKTLAKMQREPTPADLRWDEVAGALASLGFEAQNNDGSRRRFLHPAYGLSINLHKPHPQPEMKRYAIRQLVDFLRNNGFLERTPTNGGAP